MTPRLARDRSASTLAVAVAVGLLVAALGVGPAVGAGPPVGGQPAGTSVPAAATQERAGTDAAVDAQADATTDAQVDAATEVRLDVANATVDGRDAETVRVALTEAPEGLAGYRARLELRTPGVANVTAASYPDTFAHTTEPAVGPDGQSVTVEAVDLEDEIRPGATDVTLATVTVAGVDDGETELRAVEVQVDADDGGRVAPARSAGVVAVDADGGGVEGSGDDGGGEGGSGAGAEAASSPRDRDASRAGSSDSTADTHDGRARTRWVGPVGAVVAAALTGLALLGAAALARRRR